MKLLIQLSLLLFALQCRAEDEDSTKGEQVTSLKNTKLNVAIIGGGFAGLAAFKRLQPIGLQKLDLFEASNRLGGRVFPIPFEDGYLQHGAEDINGVGNPVFDIAQRLNLINDSYEISAGELIDSAVFKTGKCKFDEDLTEEFKKFAQKFESDSYTWAADSDNHAKTIGSFYKDKLQEFIDEEDRTPAQLNQIKAISEFYTNYYSAEWIGTIDQLSMKNLDTWDHLTSNQSIFVLNKIGFKAILDELTKDLPQESVHLSSKVTLIDYSGDKTRLKINGNFYETEYDYVIVTVPLGYLKKHANDMFEPALPHDKLDVIKAMGFGSTLKLFLVYEKPFWKEDGYNTLTIPLQVEGCVEKSKIAPSMLYIDAERWAPNVLRIWVGDDTQDYVDTLSDGELINQITQHFKNTMPDVNVVSPQRIIRKSWKKDENFLGSYSYITSEAAEYEDPFKLLASPVYEKQRPRILFAGEATHSTIYQTTVGAYVTGEREAQRLLRLAKKYNN